MTGTPLDSEEIQRAAGGDDAALGRLLRAVEPELRASVTVQPLWRRELDVDDVLQVAYLEAFMRIGALRERTPTAFRAWMRRLVDSNLVDAIRGLERDKRPDARRRVTHVGKDGSARTLMGQLIGPGTSASAALSNREQVERLLAAVGRLPASYRLVVEQVDLAERRVAEVAAEMGRSPGAVHLLLSRAHDRLRELLE
ncbi:RNA polymerase sigma factor [Rohdeia mirabilis]|uniref:RNA polymerase sigma factor n=1 Tax=Rohdeia mirabilis TaxID=2528008 RepID=UPI003AF3457D